MAPIDSLSLERGSVAGVIAMECVYMIFFCRLTIAAAFLLSGTSSVQAAVLSDGADGALAPTESLVLVAPPIGIFNFTAISIGDGLTTTLLPGSYFGKIQILSQGDIVIDGVLEAGGLDFVLSTPGSILIRGNVSGGAIEFLAGTRIEMFAGATVDADGGVLFAGLDGTPANVSTTSGAITISAGGTILTSIPVDGGRLLPGATAITPIGGSVALVPLPPALLMAGWGLSVISLRLRRSRFATAVTA